MSWPGQVWRSRVAKPSVYTLVSFSFARKVESAYAFFGDRVSGYAGGTAVRRAKSCTRGATADASSHYARSFALCGSDPRGGERKPLRHNMLRCGTRHAMACWCDRTRHAAARDIRCTFHGWQHTFTPPNREKRHGCPRLMPEWRGPQHAIGRQKTETRVAVMPE